MIGDAKEHICSGCYQVIASHDPEAYQEGIFYYHSKAHEDMHVSRKVFQKPERKDSREVSSELAAHT
jgi:hypothetical protein